MNETNNTQNSDKLFTQSDLDRIIGERLSRDKNKNSEELDKREKELHSKELKFIAKQLLDEKKLPTELADILKFEDEKSIVEVIETIEKLIGNKKTENKLSVVNERKLPKSKNDDENYGELRRAFGLN